jgi:hypothetical protein
MKLTTNLQQQGMVAMEIIYLEQGQIWIWRDKKQQQLTSLWAHRGWLPNPDKTSESVFLATSKAIATLIRDRIEDQDFIILKGRKGQDLIYEVRCDGRLEAYTAVLIKGDRVPPNILHRGGKTPHPGSKIKKLTYKLTPDQIDESCKACGIEPGDEYGECHRRLLARAAGRLEGKRSEFWQTIEEPRLSVGEATTTYQMTTRFSPTDYDRIVRWKRSGETEQYFVRRMMAIALMDYARL